MATFKIRSIKFNFLMNLILSGSSLLFPLITFPLVSRALFSANYGLVNWGISIVTWLSLVAMLGVNRYGIREVARVRDDASALAKTTLEILALTAITTAIVFICFIASLFLVTKFADNRALLLICSATLLCNTLGVGWFFQGIEQYSYITVRGIAIKAVCFVGVIALVHVPDDYLIYAALVTVSGAVANLVNFFYMGSILRRGCSGGVRAALASGSTFKPFRHFKQLLVFFLIVASISVYTVLDTTMLGFLSTDAQVGYYAAAINVKTALQGIVAALSGVLLPRASNMLAKGEDEQFRAVIRKAVWAVLGISVPMAVLLAAFGTPLITWYAGADFAAAGVVVSVVGFAVVPIGLSVIFCDAVMVPLGLERYCVFIYAAAAIIDFCGNLVLIPMLGALGAALATLSVEVLIAIVEFIIIHNRIWPQK